MVLRLVIAVLGGAVITVGMLLMMSDFTAKLRERDTLRYFPITDFIPATGVRARPPPAPVLPPDRPRAQYQRGSERLSTDRPVVGDPVIEAPAVQPSLDPSIVTPDEP